MPLGPQFMRLFASARRQFGFLVSAYTFAAAASGFVAAFWIDRFDRKRALLALYAGFIVATALCGIAPSYRAAARRARRRRRVRRRDRRAGARDRRRRSCRTRAARAARRSSPRRSRWRRSPGVPLGALARRALLVARAVPGAGRAERRASASPRRGCSRRCDAHLARGDAPASGRAAARDLRRAAITAARSPS